MYELLSSLTGEKEVEVSVSQSERLPSAKSSKQRGFSSPKFAPLATSKVSKMHTQSRSTGVPPIMFTVGGITCYCNSPSEMEEILNKLCILKDGVYVVRE